MAMSQAVSSNVMSINVLEKTDQTTISVLKDTLYPGAKDESIAMVLNYCRARKIDPLLKPVHLVPMSVKTGKKDGSGKDVYEWRDVVMPGIGLYRIDAARSGQYAGMSEPEFGEEVTETIGSAKVTYPKWCKVTVKKLLPSGQIVEFTAKEYWLENYATKGRNDLTPNAMWQKRGYGQIAKCTEAQALRKAFPDVVGQEYTKEEMEGKSFAEDTKVIDAASVNDAHVVETRNLEDDLQNISWANDIEELQNMYTPAYKYYLAIKNKVALKKLIDAKDKRKKEIETYTTEAVENVNSETGEVSE